jgi:S-adenosyl methyltransferase
MITTALPTRGATVVSDKFFRSVLPGDEREVPKIDTNVAHIARVYDYWLGGKDNFAVDREIGDKVLQVHPETVLSVQANRKFLARSVRQLAANEGVRQFLDIGTGLPSGNNTHEVAQAVRPEARVVYVDNDPIVLTHARALLTSASEGATAYVQADIRDTAEVLASAAETLDLSQPVAVMALMILQYVPDEDDPWGIVAGLVDALAAGSYLTISDTVRDIDTERVTEGTARLNERMGPTRLTLRSRPEFERFFSGLELAEPGVVPLPEWRSVGSGYPIPCYAGMGRKPYPG